MPSSTVIKGSSNWAIMECDRSALSSFSKDVHFTIPIHKPEARMAKPTLPAHPCRPQHHIFWPVWPGTARPLVCPKLPTILQSASSSLLDTQTALSLGNLNKPGSLPSAFKPYRPGNA
ncbi:hypothetical protein QR680_003084 [Steinernema hermaphroditum]|uniref:Uncharacterized protein n=1 Tax=Steinernema hermaphroditum TaxID=289476 RepID=A0AA39H7X9_9BILA|nr:hypothetical protein QR680_003084 [Steinernema hermaphroditum]